MMKKYMNMTLRILLPVMILMLAPGCATKATVRSAPATDDLAVITEIQPGDNSLAITGSKGFVYTIYTGNDPYKVTVDIPDMRAGSFTSKIVSSKAGISEIMPQQTDSPNPSVKLDITLQAPSSVVPVYKDNTLTLLIKPEEPVTLNQGKVAEEKVEAKEVAAAAAPSDPAGTVEAEKGSSGAAEETPPAENSKKVLAKATKIDRIALEKSPAGLKVLIIGNGTMMPNVFPLNRRIVIDIPDVTLQASLPSNAVSPLVGIRAGRHRDKVRLVLDLKEKTAFDVAAVGNTIEIALKGREIAASQPRVETPPEEAAPKGTIIVEKEPREEAVPSGKEKLVGPSYGGKKISLDFQDADVGPIFRLLADVNNYNLVLDPSVKGKITIKLMNVPWDQALDIILNQTHMSHRIEGNILWIAPVKVFDDIVKERSKLRETEEAAEPLMQEIVRVNYATAGEIQSAISSGKLLSPRGSITIDNRMNTLIVKDTQNSINKVKELVKIMDVSKPQVMIEAKLVEVDSDYSSLLGINWGGSFSSQTFPNNVGGAFSVNTPTITAGPNAVLPSGFPGGGAVNMNLGHANTFNISVSLSALESMNKSKTLSNPKVLTMDNESATIQQGTTFFIPTVSQAGTQTQSQTATLSLQVTPKITPDGYVQLKVVATDNSLQPGTAGAEAVVNTKSLTTQALVKAGETLVLGGIYRLDESETTSGVPVLSKIPGLGWIFKTKQQLGPTIKELLIFITPTIVSRPS